MKTKTHLRNSSALSAAEISVTVPLGIYKTIIAAASHAESVNITLAYSAVQVKAELRDNLHLNTGFPH